eukprot:CAMPEP_0176408176 /NCGR_PEP_ID=MMETSP0127-20121128/1806_1 /TAXON_ID=938130 /ORGANISM="Platyophrya macrostoma, Strain WH" /LENGTH=343 /DNA_ID=CAMNT_0017787433 /DNA_START=28 /DNA_END=1059 /DNA_ORIENTATION=+
MAEVKENETVYTVAGYGIVISAPSKNASNSEPGAEEKKQENPSNEQPPQDKIEMKEEKVEKPAAVSNDCDPSMVKVQCRWGGTVSLLSSQCKKKIKLNIKTYYGSRKRITVEVNIDATIEVLRNLLLTEHLESPGTIYNLRLLYPMGTMQELNVNNSTIEQYNLPDNANLVLLVQSSFTWDPNVKGADIKLSNNNLTATKAGDADYQTVLGSLQLSAGRHYWEVKIDKYGDEEDLFVGIARKEINLNAIPLETKMFWGYMVCGAKKVGSDGVLLDYGYQAKTGDIIGVLLEYKSGMATLSFYRNGAKCGVAFGNLTGTFVPAVCMNYGDIQVSLDPKATPPYS